MGREIHEVLAERLLAPIGIECLSWDRLGGSGFIGPHTKAQSGIHMSGRELARFGYLALHGGVWAGRQIIPRWWLDLATQTSQEHNPQYGYLWWVNTNGAHWPGLPRDAFAAQGFRSNRCYIIPSLDLVIARTGSGPTMWNESRLVDEVVAAICG